MGVDEICPGSDWCKGPFATFEEALSSSSVGPRLLNLGVCSLNDEYREPLLAFAPNLLKRLGRSERFLYRGEHEIDLETWIDPPWRFWPQG